MNERRACPRCGSMVGGDTAVCPLCRLDLDGSEAAALLELMTRLAAVNRDIEALSAQSAHLMAELQRRRMRADEPAVPATLPPPPPPPTWTRPYQSPMPPRQEWDVERVRALLLWVGAALLALSALTFTVVAWAHLGNGGRAALLVGATVVTVVLALALRRRLPATAEVFQTLGIALALIDWQALRRAGSASTHSGTAWWALGTVVVAACAWWLGRAVSPRPARIAVPVLVPVSLALLVVTVAGAPWSLALGFALIATALAIAAMSCRGRTELATTAGLLRAGSALTWTVAAVAIGIAATEPHTTAAALTPALVLLAVGLAPSIAVAKRPFDHDGYGLLAAIAAAIPIAAVVVVLAPTVSGDALLLVAALLGFAATVAAGWARGSWRVGTILAAVAALLPGTARAGTGALAATFAPLHWANDVWLGNAGTSTHTAIFEVGASKQFEFGWVAVAILGVVAAAWVAAATTAGHRDRLAPPRGALFVAGAVALVTVPFALVVAGASVMVACVTATALMGALVVGAALLEARDETLSFSVLALASLPAVNAAGWAMSARAPSILVLAGFVAAAAVAAVLRSSEPARSAHAAAAAAALIALFGVVPAALDVAREPSAFIAATAAAVLVAAGAWWPSTSPDRRAFEGTGSAAFLVAAALTASTSVWLAVTLTVAVPLVAVAALRPDRALLYAHAASGVAIAALWAWLDVAGVTVVEAYTAPVAVVSLALGLSCWRRGRVPSWPAYGPALVLGLGPTLALAISENDPVRSIISAALAVAVVLIGAERRLQAPLLVGATSLIALAIDTLGPAAARLPRWVPLAIAGTLLLWIGATFERRRDDVRHATHTLMHFG